MIFATYDFVAFAATFFLLYAIAPALLRAALILAGGCAFQWYYGGAASFAPIAVLLVVSWLAGLSSHRLTIALAIAACVAVLIFYKYTGFLADSLIAPLGAEGVAAGLRALAPATIPLGISFFTFEFVHYLADVYRGGQPVQRPADFAAFILFWPSMVAGPIKRYQQFLPSFRRGIEQKSIDDIATGMGRIAIGYGKKVVADYLTSYIDLWQPHFAEVGGRSRWILFGAIALRILFDFSGYSDIAIGLGRLMGIRIPENFNWPYLAASVQDFWHRWHISLSTWIRDYIYFSLGGSRYGLLRKIVNGLFAFALCGLWHGAAWNFVLWGLYHGLGLAVSANYRTSLGATGLAIGRFLDTAGPVRWIVTQLFVMVGWLYFFYPVGEANRMLMLLLGLDAK
jgi:alginate O-acetyltransferase complex protein AlgI